MHLKEWGLGELLKVTVISVSGILIASMLIMIGSLNCWTSMPGFSQINYHPADSVFQFGGEVEQNQSDWWSLDILDYEGMVGWDSQIVVDTKDKVHITYTNDDGSLKYATNSQGNWRIETINSTCSWKGHSMAIDSEDRLHVSYQDFLSHSLQYATKSSETWSTLTLDSGGEWGLCTSIAIDSEDKVHIGYVSDSTKVLEYATNALGNWSIEEVATSVDPYGISLAIDSHDNVHLFYSGFHWAQALKHATKQNDTWIFETIDQDRFGTDISSAVDSHDNLHLVCYDNNYGDLNYITNSLGSWEATTIIGQYRSDDDFSMVLDKNDIAHVSYHGSLRLNYATNIHGNWSTEVVDRRFCRDGHVGFYNSIAVDSQGTIHISYFDYISYDLDYALSEAPAPPQDLQTRHGEEFINLTWSPPKAEPGRETTRYLIYRQEAPFWNNSLLFYAGVSAEVTWYNDTSVVYGQSYRYCVSGINATVESARSQTLNAWLVRRPSCPVNITAIIGRGYINLSWSPPLDGGRSPILNYTVTRNPAPVLGIPWVIDASTEVTWYNDTSVEPGTIYEYIVTASNEIGKSEASTIVVTMANEPKSSGNDWILILALIVITAIIFIIIAAVLIRREMGRK